MIRLEQIDMWKVDNRDALEWRPDSKNGWDDFIEYNVKMN